MHLICLYIDSAKLCQYKKWLVVIVCVLILIEVDKVIATNHIVNMKDEKEYLKPNINALIKWWIPLDLLQLHWAIADLGKTCCWYLIRTTKFSCQHI